MKYHLHWDDRLTGVIQNDLYKAGCLFRGLEFKPVLSFEYEQFIYCEPSSSFIVQIDGVRSAMTEAQKNEIMGVAINWIQPLGQEGNPNDEQKLNMIKGAVQSHIDLKAQNLGFDDINSIAKYIGFANTYQADALALAQWTVSVWEYVEAELAKMQLGQRTIPTIDEAILELPTF